MAAKKQTSTRTRKASSPRRTSVTRSRVEKRVSAAPSSLMDYFKFGESYTSLVLGIVVVIFATILMLSFFKTRTTSNPASQKSTISSQTTVNDDEKKNAPAEQPPQAEKDQQRTYTVKAGDDLWKIAESEYKDGYKWVEIAKANNLTNPGVINVGNNLVLPAVDTPSTASKVMDTAPIDQPAPKAEITKEAVSSDRSINDKTYVIQHGDDLWDIAVRAYGDGYRWVEIARTNNLTNPNLIHSGNTLQIPR